MQDLTQHIGVLKQHGYRQEEALIIIIRLQLIKIIQAEINRRKWSQREAAKFLKIAQPRVAEISVCATEKFSTELLIKLLHRLNLKTAFSIKPGKNYVRPARIKKHAAGRTQNKKGGSSKTTAEPKLKA